LKSGVATKSNGASIASVGDPLPGHIMSPLPGAWGNWSSRDTTAWLTMQSGANQSQQQIPDNREKYRENRKFALQMTMASLANAATMRVLSEIRYRN
jgi:hypothetical protein